MLGLSGYVVLSTRDRVLTPGDTPPEGADCILVLGCGVYADGSPTPMLYDRLARGVELYGAGWADVLLLSGDNRSADYNELATMDRVAQDLGPRRRPSPWTMRACPPTTACTGPGRSSG